jgi:cytosolic phospholipase A2
MRRSLRKYLALMIMSAQISVYSTEIKSRTNKSTVSFSQLLQPIINSLIDTPYKNLIVNVRETPSLCSQEKDFFLERKKRTKQSIEHVLATTLHNDDVPTIGICASGGGYRALVSMLGSLQGAHNIGLLDCTTYIAGLSGSAWMLSAWFAHNGKLPLLKIIFQNELQNNLLYHLEIIEIIKSILFHYLYGHKFSMASLLGKIAANNLMGDLGKQAYNKTFSEFAYLLNEGKMPMPIMTAVVAEEGYHWLEFTPFETGSDCLQFHIPTWSLGRHFVNGLSVNKTPEDSLGYLMRLCGSAFTVNLTKSVQNYCDFLPSSLYKEHSQICGYAENGRIKVAPGFITNPQYRNAQRPLNHLQNLKVIDGGLFFNIPLPALMKKERKLDMIIVLDHSANIENGQELRKAERYAKKCNQKLPKITYRKLHTKAMSLFVDDDPTIPMVMYIPLRKNSEYSDFDPIQNMRTDGYCHTFNMQYTPEQVCELSGLTQFTMESLKEQVKDALQLAVKRKRLLKLIAR